MAGLVVSISGKDYEHVLKVMPLKLVFAFEHMYYLQNGYDCRVLSLEESLETLLSNLE